MAEGRVWALKVCGPLEVGAVNIERGGGEVVIGIVAAGSIVDVAHIEGDGDVAGVANISTVGAVDAADTADVVDADVVEADVAEALAEVELDELGLELQ